MHSKEEFVFHLHKWKLETSCNTQGGLTMGQNSRGATYLQLWKKKMAVFTQNMYEEQGCNKPKLMKKRGCGKPSLQKVVDNKEIKND